MPKRKPTSSGQKPASYYYTPPTRSQPALVHRAALTVQKKLEDMTVEEAISYQEQLIERHKKMKAGMQQYLKRRSDAGCRTPTDEVYEGNVALIDETIAVLEEVLEGFKTRRYAP